MLTTHTSARKTAAQAADDPVTPDQNQPLGTVTAMIESAHQQLAGAQRILVELGQKFTARGHELYLVGGSLRDALLGIEPKDLDFTTNASPQAIMEILNDSSATAVWDTGIQFGTISAQFNEYAVEITTYRADTYDGTTRKPHVEFGDNIDDDLVRRDFTMNAITMSINAQGLHSIYDPLNGLSALAHRTIDTPDSPEISFTDDPLRMLRAVRFQAKHGFALAERVQHALGEYSEHINRISAERIREEFTKIILSPRPTTAVQLMCDVGLLDHFFPEIPHMKSTKDEHKQHKDVYIHSLMVLENAISREGDKPDLILRLAALLHDVAKPATMKIEKNGGVSFHHHEIVGAKMTRARLRKLKYPKSTIEPICHLISLHLRFFGYSEGKWTDSAVRRYVHDAGEELPRLHKLIRSDCTTRNKRKAQNLQINYDDLEKRIAELTEQENLAKIKPELDGQQIMQLLGISEGPTVGKAWKFLKELRLEKGILGEEKVTAELLQWWSEQQSS